MMKVVPVAKPGLCPEPRNFLRHGNLLKKPEKEKAEAQYSGLFGLLSGYSLNGSVPVWPLSASSDDTEYTDKLKKSNWLMHNKRGLPSVLPWSKLATIYNELEAQNNQEASHE